MRSVLLVSHGEFADGLKNSIEMLIGKQNNLFALGLKESGGTDLFKVELKKILNNLQTDKLIVLADLKEGSPMTTTLEVLDSMHLLENTIAFGGMNVPMAVTSLTLDENIKDPKAIIDEIIVETHNQVVNLSLDLSDEDDEI